MSLDLQSTDMGLDAGDPGLDLLHSARTESVPSSYLENKERLGQTPTHSIEIDTSSTLKASFWESDIREFQLYSETTFLSMVLHRGGGRVWRRGDPTPAETGAIGMHPFGDSDWRFEGAVRYVHVYLPFDVLSGVSETVFDRELRPDQIWIPMGSRDVEVCSSMRDIQAGMLATPPTRLLLDCWALSLSEKVIRRFSSHSGRRMMGATRLPAQGVARVVEYVEAHLRHDLRIQTLAGVAAMSPFNFARAFKATTGVTPHGYVLRRRLLRARHALATGRAPIATVATACGFSSQAHLTTSFQRAFGVTPRRFRDGLA